MPEATDIAVCAVISKNYLAHLRVLCESLLRQHPGIKIYALLVDRVDGYFDPGKEPFELVTYDELDNIPEAVEVAFRYDQLELNTAVKPFFFEYLLRKHGMKKLAFFDSDILILNPLDHVWELLDRHAVVLTPHITAPVDDDSKPGELDFLISGIYNLGFIAMSDAPSTRAFLEWWKKRLYRLCIMAHDRGIHVDQKWVEYAPLFFDGVYIMRDPEYNIAYWNLDSRREGIQVDGDRVTLDGRPVAFFHFSGFDPADMQSISHHQDRFTLRDLPNLAPLFYRYRDLLMAHGLAEIRSWPYAFGAFEDGTAIPDLAREIYRVLGEDAREFGNPFLAGPGSFLEWLNSPAEGTGAAPPVITRLALEIWKRRPDLQNAYSYPPGKDREGMAAWLAAMGPKEYKLDRKFIQALHVPEAMSVRAAQAHAGAGSRLSEKGRRARITRAMARMGLGRTARRVLGARVAGTIRDWVRWGAGARRSAAPETRAGLARGRRLAVKGPMGANVIGYVSSESGVGEKARSAIRCLQAAQVPVTATHIDIYCGHRTRDDSCGGVPAGNAYACNIVAVNPEETGLTFSRLGAGFFQHKFTVGYWDWEMEQFPDEWADRFGYLDEVWVPSFFCLDTVSRVSSVPVVRIPHSVEVSDIAEDALRDLRIPEDPFVFLFTFDYHSFGERKNPLGVVRAFRKAFGDSQDAHLVIKGTDPRVDPAYQSRLASAANAPNVTLVTRYLDRPVLNALTKRCDCYVSLHRSEGFGLTMAEAMYLGKPVIATAYSGNVDFTRPDNSYPVGFKLVESDQDYGPYRKGWLWADPDTGQAAELMRHVFEHRQEAAEVGRRGAEHIRHHYSHGAVGALMKARLERLFSHYSGGS